MTRSKSVIDAWKRLERIGEEYRQSSEKLRREACKIAAFIEAGRPDGPIHLPDQYAQYSIFHGQLILFLEQSYPALDRAAALRLAEDVGNGLLDHLPPPKGTK